MSTHHVRLGNNHVFALSDNELNVLRRCVKERHLYVTGKEVKAAKALAACGFITVRDDGAFGPNRSSSNVDGERWWVELADVTIQGI
jgi:hypothetical protein